MWAGKPAHMNGRVPKGSPPYFIKGGGTPWERGHSCGKTCGVSAKTEPKRVILLFRSHSCGAHQSCQCKTNENNTAFLKLEKYNYKIPKNVCILPARPP